MMRTPEMKNWKSFDERGNVAMVFSLAFLPMLLFAGASVDYGRALSTGAIMQTAVDQAVLTAAGQSADARITVANTIINATLTRSNWTMGSPAFTTNPDGSFTGSVTISIPTTLMSMIVPTISITRAATAIPGAGAISGSAGATDDSCIFTTGEMLALTTDVMVFNGSPSVNLTGCSIRSNKSIKCNGGNIGANQAYAVGSIEGSCTNPASNSHPGQPVMPDNYAATASNISLQCGTSAGGVTWTTSAAGALPTGANVKTVSQSGYNEIHICGNLTLSGASGSLTGASPASDTVVVIENGGLVLVTGANVTAARTTFVLASGNSANRPVVTWPNGNGNSATLTMTASIGAGNPWKGMAIYQNPAQTFDSYEDNTWKPGANINYDGVLYFPNAQLTVSGNMSVGPAGCAKIVAGEFTLNGNVGLSQSAAGCAAAGVTQYTWPGTPAIAATVTRLLR